MRQRSSVRGESAQRLASVAGVRYCMYSPVEGARCDPQRTVMNCILPTIQSCFHWPKWTHFLISFNELSKTL
jgi:hypothetical protein